MIADDHISNEILRNISKDESILFKLNINKIDKFKKISKYFAIFMLIFFPIFMISLDLLFRGRISFSFYDIFILILIGGASILFYFMSSKMGSQSIEYLIITDKRIYKQYGVYKTASIDSVDINSLKAITFQLSKSDKKKQFGTIKFIPEVRVGKNYALKLTNIPNFNDFQKVIEFIVYEYADIEGRWQFIKDKLKIQFPYKIKVSEAIRDRISQKSKKHSILLIIFVPLVVFGLFMTPIAWNQENEAAMRLLLYVSLFPLIFSTMYIIIIIVQKITWKKRISDNNSILTLYSNKISITRTNGEMSIPLSSSICVDILKIEKYAAGFFRRKGSRDGIQLKWKEDLDGIIIKPSYKSKELMKFGPIENFSEIFEAIFCYILKWKASKGYLFSKEEILNYDMKKFEIPGLKSIIRYGTQQIMLPKLESLDLKPIEKSDPLYIRFGIYLESDEKIYFSYYESHKYKRMIGISLFLFIPTLILSIIIFITDIFETTIILFLLSAFIPVICCLSSIFLCSGLISKYKIGDLFYIFTNKKIFVDYSTSSCQISYDNISTILRRPSLRGKYQIELDLKRGIDGNPFEVKHGRFAGHYLAKFFINKIPSDNNLIDKLQWLIEKTSV